MKKKMCILAKTYRKITLTANYNMVKVEKMGMGEWNTKNTVNERWLVPELSCKTAVNALFPAGFNDNK